MMSDGTGREKLVSSAVLEGECVSFTGILAAMPHRQAMEIVEAHGGSSAQHVSRHTTMLVIGEEGWPLEQDGRPSQKLEYALKLQREGHPIRLVNESEWLYLVGLNERRDDVHRVYTPAMLSRLLEIPVTTIRSWEQAGLIRAVRRVFRLPYFDFQEVTSARKLHELVQSGVPISEIRNSLESMSELFGDVHRGLQQLTLLSQQPHVVYRDEHGPISPLSGQRLLDFPSEDSDQEEEHDHAGETASLRLPVRADELPDKPPEQWFTDGCRLSDSGEAEQAIEAFRECLRQIPGDPEANFQLADCLYRTGRIDGGMERLRMAIEFDPEFVEAWTQLGCLHAESGDPEQALSCLQTALAIHPDFPDAHWHCANLLEQLERADEAAVHWKTYLQFDQRGPWASDAQARLHVVSDNDPQPLPPR